MKEYSITEVATILQRNAQTIRDWQKALNLPDKRDSRNRRYFNENDLRQFEKMKIYLDEGMTMEQVLEKLDVTPVESSFVNNLTKIPEEMSKNEVSLIPEQLINVISQSHKNMVESLAGEIRGFIEVSHNYSNSSHLMGYFQALYQSEASNVERLTAELNDFKKRCQQLEKDLNQKDTAKDFEILSLQQQLRNKDEKIDELESKLRLIENELSKERDKTFLQRWFKK